MYSDEMGKRMGLQLYHSGLKINKYLNAIYNTTNFSILSTVFDQNTIIIILIGTRGKSS